MRKLIIAFALMILVMFSACGTKTTQKQATAEEPGAVAEVGEGVSEVDTLDKELATEETGAAASDLEEVDW